MPAFNLTTDGAEVEDVSITQAGNTITVGGTYVLSVKNSGVLPMLLSATVEIEELEVTGVTAAEGESETVSGSGDVEVDFSFTQQANQYQSTADSICNAGGQLDAEASGKIKGIVASSSFDEDVRTTVPNASCNLSGGGTQPGNGNNGFTEPPNGGNGDDGFTEPPNGDTGNGGDNRGDGGGRASDNFRIINTEFEEPIVNTDQTYKVVDGAGNRVENYPTGSYNWVWEFGNERTKDSASFQEIIGSPAQVTYNWNNTGTQTITVTVTSNVSDDVAFQVSTQEVIVPPQDDGGIFSVDQAGLTADDVPTMDKAAQRKMEREDGF
jgi:hypothetical protein